MMDTYMYTVYIYTIQRGCNQFFDNNWIKLLKTLTTSNF